MGIFQEASKRVLSLQPLTDNAGALLAIAPPCFRKHVIGDVVALDAKAS